MSKKKCQLEAQGKCNGALLSRLLAIQGRYIKQETVYTQIQITETVIQPMRQKARKNKCQRARVFAVLTF